MMKTGSKAVKTEKRKSKNAASFRARDLPFFVMEL